MMTTTTATRKYYYYVCIWYYLLQFGACGDLPAAAVGATRIAVASVAGLRATVTLDGDQNVRAYVLLYYCYRT